MEFVQQRVKTWAKFVLELSKAAESQPQAAYTGFTKSLQFEWALSNYYWMTSACA